MNQIKRSLRSFTKSPQETCAYTIAIIVLILTSYLYYQKASSFHFTDEFTNIIQGYFMTQGRVLYSEIFSHHQPLPNYLSFLLQKILSFTNLYQLITYHRIAIILYSVCMSILLLVRFRTKIVLFVLLFEATKIFLFGNLFLSESFVVYPLVYLTGLIIEKIHGNKLTPLDYYLASVAVWFVAFMREAYVPATVLLYGSLFWGSYNVRTKALSFGLLILLSFITIFTLPVKDYFYAIVTLNFESYIGNELTRSGIYGLGVFKLFLYPFLVFLTGEWNSFRGILIALSATLIILSYKLLQTKYTVLVLILWSVLALLSIRFVSPGNIFYEGFHLLAWYAVTIAIISFLLHTLTNTLVKNVFLLLPFIAILAVASSGFYTSSQSRSQEFYENYTPYFTTGSAIKTLAQPHDTLFLEYWPTLIYWQAGLSPAYDYSLFLPVMERSTRFVDKRATMFEKNPPTFYYYECSKKQYTSPTITHKQKNLYMQLRSKNQKPTCLFVKKNRYKSITSQRWKSVEQFGYYP
jgi:hypothetical protein